jgi:hypothetical protein
MPAAGARCEAARGACQRPGPGGAARPFHAADDPDDADVILEQIAERIAAEVEARPPALLVVPRAACELLGVLRRRLPREL